MRWKKLDKEKSEQPKSTVPKPPSGERYVGIDLGTRCGVAVKDGSSIIADTWDFKTKRTQGMGMRYLKFKAALEDLMATGPIKALFYEEVRRHKGVDAAHVYGGFESHLLAFCDTHGIPYTSIPVGTVKKKGTGKGNCGKEEMIASAQKAFPHMEFGPDDDNKADALWILASGLEELNLSI